jgi:Phage integrase, N-terminal SAM-like domain
VSCQICAITVAKIWHVSRARRNHFGGVRKLPSGRYQARYWHAGAHHSAPLTFLAKADALAWLARTQTDIRRGAWVDPAGAQMTVAELATRWLEHDPCKRASTVARDEVILRLHILPQMGKRRVGDVTPPDLQRLVNEWAKHRAPTNGPPAVRRGPCLICVRSGIRLAGKVSVPEHRPATRRDFAPSHCRS